MLPNSNKGTSKEMENIIKLRYASISQDMPKRAAIMEKEKTWHILLLKAAMSSQINVLASPTPPPSPP